MSADAVQTPRAPAPLVDRIIKSGVLLYAQVAIALIGQFVLFVVCYGFYAGTDKKISGFVVDSPLALAIEEPVVQRMQLLCVVIVVPIVFDILVDILGYFGVSAFCSEDPNALLNPRRRLADCAKEWMIRFLYLISLAFPAVLVITTDATKYTKVVIFMAAMCARLETLFCMANFVVCDTFDKSLLSHILSLTLSLLFALSVVGEYTGIVVPHSAGSPLDYTYLIARIIACLAPAGFILRVGYYSYHLLVKSYRAGGLMNLSVKELVFLTISTPLAFGMIVLYAILIRSNVDGYMLNVNDLLLHDSSMIAYALITTSLPARIARLEGRRAKHMAVSAKRNVTHTLNAPLKVVLSELDAMLDDETIMSAMNRDGVRRLARIALAADTAIGSLQRIADMDTTLDRGVNNVRAPDEMLLHFEPEAADLPAHTDRAGRPLVMDRDRERDRERDRDRDRERPSNEVFEIRRWVGSW
jgi:hypothetical protein